MLVQSKKKKKKKKANDAANASAAAASATPTPTSSTPPSTTLSSTVGGAAHVSTNPFAALDSEDEDAFDQDVGVSYASIVGNSTKAPSSLYLTQPSATVSSECIGSSSHVPATCNDSSSNAAASHALRSSVLIADSGATDHMWHDYSAFTSYHPTTSKHVTLADNTKAPVAGIGSIKILLNGCA